jgi:hypothetical protein
MVIDADSEKKLQRFWQKKLLLGVGKLEILGLGYGPPR